MYTSEEILHYHCPRWNEWPGIDLYMDQVINLLEENVSIFYTDNQSKPVTSTMINNYVKQKIIIPSKKKRYQRDHLAYLYIIFLLKPVLSLTDICDGISFLRKLHTPEESYNLFCDEIEAALVKAFGGTPQILNDDIKGIEVIQTIAMAFAYTLLARYYISTDKEALDKGEKHE